MRAAVLSGFCNYAWKVGPRSSTDLKQAAEHYERAATLSSNAPGAEGRARPTRRLVPQRRRGHVRPNIVTVHLQYVFSPTAGQLKSRGTMVTSYEGERRLPW